MARTPGQPTLFELPRPLHRGEYGCCVWCGRAGKLEQGERHGVWADNGQWWCRRCHAEKHNPKE